MVFQRLRVANIRQKLNLENLFHIDGKHNLADFGTRPDLVTADLLRPESEWIKGKKWMTMSIEDAQKTGILKNTRDIILDNDLKKELRKGAIFDDFEQADHIVNHIDVKKVAEIEVSSNYLYSPLKRTFRSVVRINAYVILAWRKFKRKLFLAKHKRGEKLSDGTTLDNLNFSPPKFVSFPITVGENTAENLNDSNNTSLTDLFQVQDVIVTRHLSFDANKKPFPTFDKHKYVIPRLTDEHLSAALEYLFKVSTKEIYKYKSGKFINNGAITSDT